MKIKEKIFVQKPFGNAPFLDATSATSSTAASSDSRILTSSLSRYPFSNSSSSCCLDFLPELTCGLLSGCGGGGGGGGAVCVEALPETDAAISGWKVLSRG